MAQYDEREYFTDSQEEIAEREAQEAMRRLVRTEIRRIQSGAADEDIAEDMAREEAEKEAEEKQARRKNSWLAKLEGIFTGDILLAEEASQAYNFLALLGIIFLVSIFTMFGTFQREIRCNDLQAEIKLLKERSIRTLEARVQHSSHAAILQELQERGIELEDPSSTPTILK